MMNWIHQAHVIVGLAILIVAAFSYVVLRSMDP